MSDDQAAQQRDNFTSLAPVAQSLSAGIYCSSGRIVFADEA